MKKFTFLLFMTLATMFFTKADSYFTMGENDVIRINPNRLNQAMTVPVKAHFDEREDFFFFSIIYPQEMSGVMIGRGPDMDIHYTYFNS